MIGVDSADELYRQERARFLSPDFFVNGTSNIFDYAIIEFEPPLEEKDMAIASPACLPLNNTNIVIGSNLLIAGWGGKKNICNIDSLASSLS